MAGWQPGRFDVHPEVRSVYREDPSSCVKPRRFFEKCVPAPERWSREGIVDREVWEKAGWRVCQCVHATEYGGRGDFGHPRSSPRYARASVSGFALTLQSEVVAPTSSASARLSEAPLAADICAGRTILAVAITGSPVAARTSPIRHDGHPRRRPLRPQRQQDLHQQRLPVRLRGGRVQTDPRPAPWASACWSSTPAAKDSGAVASCARWGCRPQDTAELFFDDVRAPVENRLWARRARASVT